MKSLLAFIILVGLAGLGYWFFFKRGKKPVDKAKVDVKVTPHGKLPHTSHPISVTDSKIEPAVLAEKTMTVKKETTVAENPDTSTKTT